MSEWINIEDRLPEKGVYVLFTDGIGMIVGYVDGYFEHGKRNFEYIKTYGIRGYEWDIELGGPITHWMPLPPMPVAT